MKILLVHPPNTSVYKGINREINKSPPIGLAYIAAVLKQNNFNVNILDAEAFNMNETETIKSILNENVNLVGFTVTTPLIYLVKQLCEKLKKENSNIKTVIGGPHVSALPKETLENNAFDYIIFGEGEYTFLELVQNLNDKKDLSEILGLGYKDKTGLHINNKRHLINNLDTLPFPAYELLPTEKYINMYFKKKFALMISSRGCPYQCIFCGSSSTFGHNVRYRSPKNFVDEIEYIIKTQKINRFLFTDDTFTLNKQHTIEICKLILERGINIKFICSSRANTFDEERAKYLKQAGCWMITFGVESGDEEILKIIKKGITKEQVRTAIGIAKKYGIHTHASYMIGNPTETLETINNTIKFAYELNTDFAQFSISTPFPGTELWDIAKKNKLIKTEDFSKYKWNNSVVYLPPNLTEEDLKRIQKETYSNYKQGIKNKE